MLEHDRSNFLKLLQQFPGQITSSVALMKNFKTDVKAKNVRDLVIAGMGGSAISGDLLIGYMSSDLKIPAVVNRDYEIPNFVGENTLFIALSYSGTTEETLTATRSALARKATVIGISSGGELQALCEENGCQHIKIEGGLPPRQALGYIFFPLLMLMEAAGFLKSQKAAIEETIQLIETLDIRYDPKRSFGNNLANHIAQSIYHAIPVCYSGAPYLSGIPVRWRNQFNENSKVMAFSNVFPELNHNEIMGWEGLPEVNKHFRVIFLRCPDEHARIKERIRITKEILRKNKILFGEVFAEGESRLARMFSLIYTSDWASYYLAMLNGKDPIDIKSIDYLKQKLSEATV